MGSISSASSNLQNLLQTLSAESPQLSSLLSNPKVQSGLEKASPGDLVELSHQALQLQQVDLLFGSSTGTEPVDPNALLDSIFSVPPTGSTNPQSDPIAQALQASLGASPTSKGTTSPGSFLAGQISGIPGSPQMLNLETLLGATPLPLFNTLG